jgi:uncharacterized protein (DUF2141 family)
MSGRSILLACLLWLATGPAVAADLTITITGLRSAEGMVRLAIFDDADAFPMGEELDSRDVPARAVAQTVVFTGLKPGRYAVAMHHDENNNKEMDTFFFVIPREGYGFSRDAPVFFGPPDFSQAAVTVPAKGLQISLEVRY